MKTELTEVTASRRRLTVEVAADEVQAEFDRALRDYRKAISVPGFRKGKAPLELIRRRIGGTLPETVAEKIVEAFAPRAIAEKGLRPIEGSVSVELDEGGDKPRPAHEGSAYSFTLIADVMPAIEPKDYVGQQVARPAVEIDPDEVHREIDGLRESLAKMVPVDGRASAGGDFVEVDIEGAELGGVPVAERRTQTIELGKQGNLPAFERGLTGLRPGESFAFEVEYPQEFPQETLRGKVIYFKGEVRAVMQRIVPELDEETLRRFGEEIRTPSDLREKVEQALTAKKQQEAERVTRRRLLGKLLDGNPIDPPQSLVEQEIRERLQRLGRQLALQGVDPEKIDIDWKQVIEEQRQEADRVIRESLLLDAIAEKESLTVSQEELDRAISEIAEDVGEKPAAVRTRLIGSGALEGLRSQVLRRKCLDWLMAAANIV